MILTYRKVWHICTSKIEAQISLSDPTSLYTHRRLQPAHVPLIYIADLISLKKISKAYIYGITECLCYKSTSMLEAYIYGISMLEAYIHGISMLQAYNYGIYPTSLHLWHIYVKSLHL